MAYLVQLRGSDHYVESVDNHFGATFTPDLDRAARFDSEDLAQAIVEHLPYAAVTVGLGFTRLGTCRGCGHNQSFRNRHGICRYAGSLAEKDHPACGHFCLNDPAGKRMTVEA